MITKHDRAAWFLAALVAAALGRVALDDLALELAVVAPLASA
jgi:hypothetical protein